MESLDQCRRLKVRKKAQNEFGLQEKNSEQYWKERQNLDSGSKEKSYKILPRRGDSHMKQTGMLVVSLRGVDFGFWSRLGCSGHSANILSRQETQNDTETNRSQNFSF